MATKVTVKVQMSLEQKTLKDGSKKLSHMSVNRLPRDDYESREKYMKALSIKYAKRTKWRVYRKKNQIFGKKIKHGFDSIFLYLINRGLSGPLDCKILEEV